MRPPILWITVGFGVGLAAGVRLFGDVGAWALGLPVAVGVLALARRAPVAAAMGIATLVGSYGVKSRCGSGRRAAGGWGKREGCGPSSCACWIQHP